LGGRFALPSVRCRVFWAKNPCEEPLGWFAFVLLTKLSRVLSDAFVGGHTISSQIVQLCFPLYDEKYVFSLQSSVFFDLYQDL